MSRLFISIYEYFNRHRLIWILSMIAVLGVFGFYASKIYLEEDIVRLLPSSRNEDGSIKLAFSNLRIKDKTFIVFEDCDGVGIDQLCETVDVVCDSLLATEVDMPDEEKTIVDLFSSISTEDLLYDAVDYVEQHLPSFIDTAHYAAFDTLLTEENVLRQMHENRDQATSLIGEAFPELLQMDPIGMRHVLQDQLLGLKESLAGSYRIINGHLFVPDSTAAVVILTPQFSGTDSGHNAGLIRRINQIIEWQKATTPGINIGYYGTTARGAYNSWTIKHDIMLNVLGSLALVLLVIGICFRHWNTIPLLLLPVGFGTVFGLAMMYFIKGQFSLLALGIGAVVLGVALSYVLHVVTHYKYVGDPIQVLKDQTKPVLMGCITTIGSFLGLIFIQTDLLQDFGLFATFAIVGTTLFSLIWLPPFFNQQSNRTNRRAFALIDRINAYPIHRNRPLLFVIGLLTCISIGYYLWGGTNFDADMRNLGYIEPQQEQLEARMRAKMSSGLRSQYFAAGGETMEEALANFEQLSTALDSLQKAGLVKKYTQPDKLFIPASVQQQRIEAWANYWTPERLEKAESLIARCAPKAGLNAEAFAPFFEAATRQYEPDALYEAGIIPEGYQTSLMEQSYDGSYLCFSTVYCELDSVRSESTPYHRICDAIANRPNLMVLDTYYYATDTLRQLGKDFDVLQWVSMAFVLLVLLISFKWNVKISLLCFLPIVISWIIVLGAMNIFGLQFNLINIIISTFIFGIGVDYSIFIMCGLIESGQDKETDSRNKQLLKYHKTAILLSALVLIITVGSMNFATHPAIQSVGFATLVGLCSAVIFAYVVEPFMYKWLMKK